MDGSLLRTPDTPENRAAFESVGTADDSAAWRAVRLFPLNNCRTRSLLAMPWRPAGTDKAAAEQSLVDTVLTRFAHVLTKNQVLADGPALARCPPDRRPIKRRTS